MQLPTNIKYDGNVTTRMVDNCWELWNDDEMGEEPEGYVRGRRSQRGTWEGGGARGICEGEEEPEGVEPEEYVRRLNTFSVHVS